MSQEHGSYYVPEPSYWPVVATIGMLTTFVGAAQWMHRLWFSEYVFFTGLLVITITLFGWFGTVIHENQSGLYKEKEDLSFRWGMAWFIFSEVCFFGAFFGALFFARFVSVPELGGEFRPITHLMLWPDFHAVWPLLSNPDNTKFVGADEVMKAWGVPALNTMILLTSGLTITWAHWGLKMQKNKHLILGLLFTILLGITFLIFQALEYHEALMHMNLNLNAGIYGATFFMLTGFHGAHVTIGTIILCVMLYRATRHHFSPHNHFAFEAAAWYWHFVDVVWLFLFVFVYWI